MLEENSFLALNQLRIKGLCLLIEQASLFNGRSTLVIQRSRKLLAPSRIGIVPEKLKLLFEQICPHGTQVVP